MLLPLSYFGQNILLYASDMNAMQFFIKYNDFNVNTTNVKNNKEFTVCGKFSSFIVEITIMMGTCDYFTQNTQNIIQIFNT